MSLNPRELVQTLESNMDEHEILCYSRGKMCLIAILKQGLGVELGNMSQCMMWVLTKSDCSRTHINRGIVWRIREVRVPLDPLQIRQLCNSSVFVSFFQFFLLKTFLNLQRSWKHCIRSTPVGSFIWIHQLLTFCYIFLSLSASPPPVLPPTIIIPIFIVVEPFESKLQTLPLNTLVSTSKNKEVLLYHHLQLLSSGNLTLVQ